MSYLETKLYSYISNTQNRADALEILTTPTRLSFYQEEEIELSTTKNLRKHQQKYFWLKNSYAGTQILPISFFAEHKKTLKPKLKKEIIEKSQEGILKKKSIQKKFKLPVSVTEIVKAISYGIGWQDERKKHIFISLHYIDLLGKEIARRGGYKISDFNNLWYFEVAQILEGKKLYQIVFQRKKGFGVQFFHTCRQLTPGQTAYVWQTYEAKKVKITKIEVKGIIASKGNGKKVSGKIHILLDPAKDHTLKKGEILVAPMTSPEYIFAMKKAVAILTDTGGLTSHAAIISRELQIPCLVGTKLSTKIFKDGDLVEINPQTGIARKIK